MFLNPHPTLAALAVNKQVLPANGLNIVPVFQSIERAHHVTIRLTHTGIVVRSRAAGKILYKEGEPANTSAGKAQGSKECSAMRVYAVGFLNWAKDNLPADGLTDLLKGISDGRF